MKSPMNMAPFKLKSAPVNMNTPGSVAKLAGVSPMKEKVDVTNEPQYSKQKKAGKTVYRDSKTGQISTSETVAKMSSPAKSTTKMPTLPPKKLKVKESYVGQTGPSKPNKKMNRRYS